MDISVEVKKYYEDYDEDSRLVKDKAHSVEFITTTRYLDKFIESTHKILEVGAATGRYSFNYAKKGCDVTALELCEKHVEIMKEKSFKNSIDIKPIQGNALDLSEFKDNSFDIVLCLGPIYHLTSESDRNKCIKECYRVLKPNGILAISYANQLAQLVKMIHRDKDFINDTGLERIVEKGCEFGDENDFFYFSNFKEIENLMKSNNLDKLHHLGTDGLSDMLRSTVNQFNDDEFKKWLNYHFKSCEDESIIGYSMHGLYIGKKSTIQ